MHCYQHRGGPGDLDCKVGGGCKFGELMEQFCVLIVVFSQTYVHLCKLLDLCIKTS